MTLVIHKRADTGTTVFNEQAADENRKDNKLRESRCSHGGGLYSISSHKADISTNGKEINENDEYGNGKPATPVKYLQTFGTENQLANCEPKIVIQYLPKPVHGTTYYTTNSEGTKSLNTKFPEMTVRPSELFALMDNQRKETVLHRR